jgi:pimeloyl-ACP methyl ester carboxylesterase
MYAARSPLLGRATYRTISATDKDVSETIYEECEWQLRRFRNIVIDRSADPPGAAAEMPWNEEVRATWARMERLAASPGTFALLMPLVVELDVRAVLRTVRAPTLVLQHADDPIILPALGKQVADHISGSKLTPQGRRTATRIPLGDRVGVICHGDTLRNSVFHEEVS